MFSILKDLINPFNWIKLIKNPRKIKVLYVRLFSYPGINFKNIRLKIFRNLYKRFSIEFLNFIAKKNKNLNYFFYDNANKQNFNDIKIKDITFQLDDNKNITDTAFENFQRHGIIVIENVISEREREKIIKVFNNFSKNKKIINLTKDQKSIDVNATLFNSSIENFEELFLINSKITKKVFGKEVLAQGQFFIYKTKKLPESIHPGDNNLHMDRYLPNLKLIYFPFDVEENLSPYRYALGSHKINNSYKDFFLNNDDCVFDDRNKKSENFTKNTIKATVKKNSLALTCTNGFHGRSPFEKHGERLTLFMTYPNFDLIDLFNYLKINRKNSN